MTANEYVASKLGGYDWRGKQSQVGNLNREYQAQQATAANTANEPSLRWRGDNPNQVMYNPGGTNWSPLAGEQVTDPAIIKMLQGGAAGGGLNAGAYQNVLSKVNPTTMQGVEGSSHSLSPSVISKMWR